MMLRSLTLKHMIFLLISGTALTFALILSTIVITQKRAALLEQIERAQSVILRVLAFDLQTSHAGQGFNFATDEAGQMQQIR